MCGKGVGLGFLLGHSKPLYGVGRLHKVFSNRRVFDRIVWTVYEKNDESPKKSLFFGNLWANFGCVSQIPVVQF